MKIKRFIVKVHLWTGLSIGVVFFFIAVSGAALTWEHEIATLLYKQNVEAKEQPFVSVAVLKTTLAQAFPKGDFRTAFYRGRTSAVEVLLYVPGTYYKAFLNPYTGALIHLQDMKKGILNTVVELHRTLLLGSYGRQIVRWITFISLFMLITGLILWWPTRLSRIKPRLMLKWGASPKRLNYDLHNVMGFYASWICIFTIITGLFFGFEVVRSIVRTSTDSNKIAYDRPLSDADGYDAALDQYTLIDGLLREFLAKHPAKFIKVSNPHDRTDPVSFIVSDPLGSQMHHYYFDRYSGDRILGYFEDGLQTPVSRFTKLNELIFEIHFGSVLGLPGRFMVFFSSLIFASLPITGFIVWLGKRNNNSN